MAGQKESSNDIILVIFFVWQAFLLIAGLGCLAVGIWMYADKDVMAYLHILRRDPYDDVMMAIPGLLIVCGVIIIGVFILGIFAVIKESFILMATYTGVLVLIMIIELTAGSLVAVFKNDIHKSLKGGMQETLDKHYQHDNSHGKAWNRVQVREECAGVDGSWDYHRTRWWYEQNPQEMTVEAFTTNCPDSACGLAQFADKDKEDPQNPQLRDRTRCNQDSHAKKTNSEYVNKRGCYAKLLDFIYVHIDLMIGLGLAVGFMQLIGLCCSVIECVRYRKIDPNDY